MNLTFILEDNLACEVPATVTESESKLDFGKNDCNSVYWDIATEMREGGFEKEWFILRSHVIEIDTFAPSLHNQKED